MSILNNIVLKSQKQALFNLIITMLLIFSATDFLFGQSLDIPAKGYGISFGNSKYFNGLRTMVP